MYKRQIIIVIIYIFFFKGNEPFCRYVKKIDEPTMRKATLFELFVDPYAITKGDLQPSHIPDRKIADLVDIPSVVLWYPASRWLLCVWY